MKHFCVNLSIAFMAISPWPANAGVSQLTDAWTSTTQEHIHIAAADDRQDRRQERGRSDERQDKRDCRQDEGRVGKDKRDCKQEEVRDGVRGHQGGSDSD